MYLSYRTLYCRLGLWMVAWPHCHRVYSPHVWAWAAA